MTAPLNWTHPLAEIGPRGVERERGASAEERARLAAALAIPEIARLTARYAIRPGAGGRYRLSGSIGAEAIQECVVTLAPVPGKIEEKFEAEFWPKAALPEPSREDVEVLSGAEIEPLDGDAIDVGRIVYETLAAALDPYPRAPDAAFDWRDPAEGETSAPASPFAALEALKPKT